MLGEKLLELRKKTNLSQEDVAFKLNVTRQTVSKWETNQSVPDFDKILPLCELYKISPNELLGVKTDTWPSKIETVENDTSDKVKKAKMMGLGIFFYFLAIVLVMILIPVLNMNPIIAVAIFILICGIGTYMVVVAQMSYSRKHEVNSKIEKLRKEISEIMALVTVIIYLVISFFTGAWHITWFIWILYAIADEVIKLIFILRGGEVEE